MATVWPLVLVHVYTILSIVTSQTSPASEPGCSANYGFVEVSSNSLPPQTLTSQRVNFSPYFYSQTIPQRKLVPFGAGHTVSTTFNNPCDISTWTVEASDYDNSIVLIQYSSDYTCSTQKWTLNLEAFANVAAVLVANDVGTHDTYSLFGDSSLTNPTIPTRMISNNDYTKIQNVWDTTTEDIFVSFDCFDTTTPPTICLLDNSAAASHIELDGEFQKQATISVNSHPVWYKEDILGFGDYYVWLKIDSSWKWVIGRDYTDDTSIIAECLLPYTNIADPSWCGHHWFDLNGHLLANITSSDTACDLGDNYLCTISSTDPSFMSKYGGRYRQIHPNTPIWISQTSVQSTKLTVEPAFTAAGVPFTGYSYVITDITTSEQTAACFISSTEPTKAQQLDPESCINWYIKLSTTNSWVLDTAFMMDSCRHPAISTTAAPTEQGCSSNYAFVNVKDKSGAFISTATTYKVQFPPYAYPYTVIHRELVEFAGGALPELFVNNPCDTSTWTVDPAYYDGKIVMFTLNDVFTQICNVQQWTLNLESYANVVGVLVANNAGLTNVYAISGDTKLPDPTIPTRIISQISAANIRHEMNETGESVFIDIDCFDIEHPAVICMLDTSEVGNHVMLDGEYQEQAGLTMNDHPVWTKQGMTNVWDDYYIWLTVNHSSTHNPWRWVIGSNYNDDTTIIAQCLFPYTQSYIDDPTLCGNNWYLYNEEKIPTLTSNDGVCDLGDSFVCSDSGSGFFNYYFAGRYRQIHDGVPVWFADQIGADNGIKSDGYLGIANVNESFASGLSFIFAYAQSGNIYAFCPIADGWTLQTLLEPWNCNENWYVVAQFDAGLSWINDPLMDIDQCQHPNATSKTTSAPITYPATLCVMDPTYTYSHYQTYYGVYTLDMNTVYDERYIYRNQRLYDSSDEWNIIWYDEKDSWVFNDGVPDVTFVSMFEGICREQVNSPDLCNECWDFYTGVSRETNCNVQVFAVTSQNEAECMKQPINNLVSYTPEISLCFNGMTGGDPYQHPLTGKWLLESRGTYRNRAYWYLLDEVTGDVAYYMYYDDVYRFWVIDTTFVTSQDMMDLYCLRYDEFEPFNCDTWYSTNNGVVQSTVTMDNKCTLQPTADPIADPTVRPTAAPTLHPTAECVEHNKFVHAESFYLDHVLTSAPMNFPPYASNTFYRKKLVRFENGRNYTKTMSNPCDAYTWQEGSAFYMDKVVMIEYVDMFDGLCTVQEWLLGLEIYGVVGVLIANNDGLDHVYSLSGHDSLLTTIPARMISQLAGTELNNAINLGDEVFISFDCFDDSIEFPSVICLSDTSTWGQHVYLDGEYQRQGRLEVNDHPVYYKMGHMGLWHDIYIFLDVDRSVSGQNAWKWVIATDFYDSSTAFAECKMPNGEHINHPALCGNNWFVGGQSEPTITTSNSTCALSDDYMCVESSPGAWFEFWFDGRYRQIHDNTALWLLQDAYIDAYITVGRISMPQMFSGNPWAFILMVNQTDIWAFCLLGDGVTIPTIGESLEPHKCNQDWYVYGVVNNQYSWYIDLAFDIDECLHQNISTTAEQINYPQQLCLHDPTYKYSHYQSKYGIYVLDTQQTYDGRQVYYNQRLHDNGNTNEWYMLWFDEKDSWVINENIPGVTVVHNTDGICREDVATPDLCTACWEFYEGYTTETNCDITVEPITSLNEADCMVLPNDHLRVPTDSLHLCFDDGFNKDWDNGYTGKWYREPRATYNGRSYWYKLGSTGYVQFYMYYDENWRFWVIDRNLGSLSADDWHFYCLKWDEFEPFNCDTWYTTIDNYEATLSMSTQCESLEPTVSPTLRPTAVTNAPSKYPTVACNARNSYVYADWTHSGLAARTITSEKVNFAPFVYDSFVDIELVLFENGRNISDDGLVSNPCDIDTWLEEPEYYDDKVVMVEFNELCNPELWTKNLEIYANVQAVLVSNPVDLTHVYELHGDESMEDPTIPTRMVSEFGGILLEYVIKQNEDVFISFGCFDDENGIDYPSIICLVDTSMYGHHVYLDGEYQRQGEDYLINDHPVWLKTGFDGLWRDIYMFLDVDQSVNGESGQKWVIGLIYDDPNRDNVILAECKTDVFVDHPALCDNHWYIDDELMDSITTSDTICELGDSYICVDAAPGGVFDAYFGGQYRQTHDGVALWLHTGGWTDIYITVGSVTMPEAGIGVNEPQLAFTFVINQTEIWAFCPIYDPLPSRDDYLSPWLCNDDWYVLEFNLDLMQYQWVIDYAMDIDQCQHPDISTTQQSISYPQQLCLNDATNTQSPYQSHYGVYILDYTQVFDGKYVYYNQRLKNHETAEWYIIWYEEKDAWVINEYVPPTWSTVVREHEGICREDVLTPDLCSACWEFYYFGGLHSMPNCNVKLEVTYSRLESDCIDFPRATKSKDEFAKEMVVGFSDNRHKNEMDEHPFSGQWMMEENEDYAHRAYWVKEIDLSQYNNGGNGRRLLQDEGNNNDVVYYYMFYNDIWRYWVVNHRLADTEMAMYCMDWRSFEPWNCSIWYTQNSTILMDTSYTLPSEQVDSSSTTKVPGTTKATIDVSTNINDNGSGSDKVRSSNIFGFGYDSWIMWVCIGGVGLCCLTMGCMLCIWRRRDEKRNLGGGRARISMDSISKSDEGDDVFDLIQMEAFGTSKFKGEHLDLTQLRAMDGRRSRTGSKGSSNGTTPTTDGQNTTPVTTSKHSGSGTPLFDNKPDEDDMFVRRTRQSITAPPANTHDHDELVRPDSSDDEDEDEMCGIDGDDANNPLTKGGYSTGERKQSWVKFAE